MRAQINRLLELVYILLHRKNVSAKELADQLGVSRRTIYRDIDALSSAGIPVYTVKGKGGGVRLLANSVLLKSVLSEQEQDEILTALHGLSNVKDSEADHVLRKLSTTFNKPATNWLQVDFSDWMRADSFFDDFKVAILERRIAEFDYYGRSGEKTSRRVEPVQLWFKEKSWYLKCFCLNRQDVRIFKLSRVSNLAVTDNYFLERDLPVLAEEEAEVSCDQDQNDQSQNDECMKLHISSKMKFQALDDFDEEYLEEQPDGSLILTVPWVDDEWMVGYVLSYGRHIEALEPESLRLAIKDEAEKISARYL
ncbi:MAG: YafY family transcriptional regulator [Coriobacteriia bacterium]|nr:YafY family transcriptional regulator [Coriobacteriia bacterium]